jgi:hypothetical protein
MNGMKPLLLDNPSDEWKMDGVPAYRVEQVRNWIFEKGVLNWDEMTNLPASLRADMNSQWATLASKGWSIDRERANPCNQRFQGHALFSPYALRLYTSRMRSWL